MVCDHVVGDYFELIGGNLSFPAGQVFGLYTLASLLSLLPAKQRHTDPKDWMSTDDVIACLDPHCGALFKIMRTRKRSFKHSDVSALPLKIHT